MPKPSDKYLVTGLLTDESGFSVSGGFDMKGDGFRILSSERLRGARSGSLMAKLTSYSDRCEEKFRNLEDFERTFSSNGA